MHTLKSACFASNTFGGGVAEADHPSSYFLSILRLSLLVIDVTLELS